MNMDILQAIYDEYVADGRSDEGDIGDLAIGMAQAYLARGGTGDWLEVETWFYEAIFEGRSECDD
jgi:hypothetical protein